MYKRPPVKRYIKDGCPPNLIGKGVPCGKSYCPDCSCGETVEKKEKYYVFGFIPRYRIVDKFIPGDDTEHRKYKGAIYCQKCGNLNAYGA